MTWKIGGYEVVGHLPWSNHNRETPHDADSSTPVAPASSQPTPPRTSTLGFFKIRKLISDKPESEYRMQHAKYGDVLFQRMKAEATDTEGIVKIKFNICLTPPGQREKPVKDVHTVFVDNRVSESTMGYSDIFFEGGLQRKGIGYLYHYALANEAKKLGVCHIEINSVLTDSGIYVLCNNTNMKPHGLSAYRLDPETFIKNLEPRLVGKGWTIAAPPIESIAIESRIFYLLIR